MNIKKMEDIKLVESFDDADFVIYMMALRNCPMPWHKVNELNIIPKDNGKFSTIWMIPSDMVLGEYEIIADDGVRNVSIKFTVN